MIFPSKLPNGVGESQKLLLKSDQIRTPSDFQLFLCNGENKERLFELIEGTWIRKRETLENRVVYLPEENFAKRLRENMSGK